MKSILIFCLLLNPFRGLLAQSTDEAVLKKLNRDFGNAIVNKDSSLLAGVLADDFIMVNPAGQILNKKDNLAVLANPGMTITSLSIDSVKVRLVSPTVGIVSCWQTFSYNMNSTDAIGKNCYQDVYVKRKGRWQAVSAHVTSLPSK